MGQVAVPIIVMLVISLAGAWGGVHIGRRLSRGGMGIVCSMAVAAMLAHALFLGDNLLLARWIPSADVLVWGNIQPVATGLLAGVVWSERRMPQWQRVLVVVALTLLAVYRAYWPMMGSPPEMRAAVWQDDVCRQTTLSTCSAAAAATALRLCGIDASESEMGELCLTRPSGTTNLGLYRGLKLKTAGTAVTLDLPLTRCGRLGMDGESGWFGRGRKGGKVFGIERSLRRTLTLTLSRSTGRGE